MTNEEIFKTAKEQTDEFTKWCIDHRSSGCDGCELHSLDTDCKFAWLKLETPSVSKTYKPLNCPFCGSECTVEEVCTNEHHEDGWWFVSCKNDGCGYSSGNVKGKEDAVSRHNSVANGVHSHGKYVVYCMTTQNQSGFVDEKDLSRYDGKLSIIEGRAGVNRVTHFNTYKDADDFRKRCIVRNQERQVVGPYSFVILQTCDKDTEK